MRRLMTAVLTAALLLLASVASTAEKNEDWQEVDYLANFTLEYDANSVHENDTWGTDAIEFTYRKTFQADSVLDDGAAICIGDAFYDYKEDKLWIPLINYSKADGTYINTHIVPTPTWNEVEAGTAEDKLCHAVMTHYLAHKDDE